MLRPAVNQIITKNESCYSLVIAVARRAREISEELYKNGETLEEKVIPRVLNFRNKTLALQSNISIIFRVDPVYFTTHGYSNPVVIFTLNGTEYPVSEYNVNKTSGLYEFAFNGIAPHQMKDMVSAVFTAEYEGEVYTSAAQEYSIFTYCKRY